MENLVSVEAQREFDLFTGEWADRIFVKLYVAARTSGLLAEISDRDWKTLCTLATYMDADGEQLTILTFIDGNRKKSWWSVGQGGTPYIMDGKFVPGGNSPPWFTQCK